MEVQSDIMEELWKIKEEIASQYKTFREFAEDMLRYQAERYPEFAERTPARTRQRIDVKCATLFSRAEGVNVR